MRLTLLCRVSAAVALFACPATVAQANILDDFNTGIILADFQFDDVAGTDIISAVNSAGPDMFDFDADSEDVVTNGLGQLDASFKANTDFGTNYVDLTTINGGRAIALYDVSWAFDESVYDPAQDEEFRLTLISFDPRSTFVTAEIFFTRTSATEVTLYGNGVGTGSSDTPDTVLGSSGDLLVMMDVNLTADVFEMWASSDDGVSFTSLGTGTLDSARNIESLRLVLNEDFSDDTLLINRFAVAVPEPTALVLAVMGGLLALGRTRV